MGTPNSKPKTRGLFGRAMRSLDSAAVNEVFAEFLADGISIDEAAQAVATAHVHRGGGGPDAVGETAAILRKSASR